MKISGIIFDKDGTLLDFNEFWIPAAQCVIRRILSDYKIPVTDIHTEKALNSIGIIQNHVLPDGSFAWKTFLDMAIDMKPALEAMHAQAPVDTRDLEGKLTRYFDEESFAENKSIKGIGDLPAILQPLHEKSIHFGVATTDTCEAAVKCLKGLQILPLFSFFAGDQMAGDMPLKPDGRIISRAAAQWHIAPENILVVGDTINDMNFAHNGGAIAVGVLSGVSSREQLAPAADFISGTHPAIRTERTVRQNGICISCHCNCLGGYRHKLSEADGGLYKADPVADLRGGVYCLPLHLCKKSEPDQPEYRIRNLVRRWTDCHLAGFDFCIQGKTLHGWNHRSCADYRRLRNGERLWKQVIAALCGFAVLAGAAPMNGCEVTYV